jgi:hypothetical protein
VIVEAALNFVKVGMIAACDWTSQMWELITSRVRLPAMIFNHDSNKDLLDEKGKYAMSVLKGICESQQ